MNQYENTNDDQQITLCGRCMKEFDGGPGKPFCEECIEFMRIQNGNPPSEEDQSSSTSSIDGFKTI